MAAHTYDRRSLLRAGGAVALAGVAGCLGGEPDPELHFGFDDVKDEVEERVHTIYERTEALCGRGIEENTSIDVVDRSEQRDRLEGSTAFSDNRVDEFALALLSGTDESTSRDGVPEGAYFPEVRRLSFLGPMSGLTDQTIAHELFHAIQFQNASIDPELGDDFDETIAMQSLIEGAGTFVERQYARSCGDDFDECDLADPVSREVTVETLPEADFFTVLPYVNGLEFVADLHDRGGWDRIWDAHGSPPTYSGQVLKPEWYPDERPEEVAVDAADGAWDELDRRRLGMGSLFGTLWLADALETETLYTDVEESRFLDTVRTRSPITDAWRGDQLVVYGRDDTDAEVDQLAGTWQIRFEDADAAAVARDRFEEWAGSRGHPTPDDGVWIRDDAVEAVTIDDRDVLVGHAPSTTDLEALDDRFV